GARALLESRNRRMANAVGSTDIGHRLACLAPSNRFPSLERTELRLSTKSNASRHSAFPTLRGSGENHGAFECSQCSKHGKDQLAVWTGRVDHRIGKRFETSTFPGRSIEDVQ